MSYHRKGPLFLMSTLSMIIFFLLSGCEKAKKYNSENFTYRAGEDSLKYNIAIGDDERRGEAARRRPENVKREIAKLLNKLRTDEIGLKQQTEFNIESYFTVADAFEADGLLGQAVDYLNDLKRKLQELINSRGGRKHANSLIETENDILHFRDAHNIHVMDDKYMAGAQPTEKGYTWLKSKGVTTIINLRLPSKHEKELVNNLGMKYIHIPWPDERPPSMAQVEQMLSAVENSKGRVFQHCLRGIGRDMTMSGSYMIAKHGGTAEKFINWGKNEAPRWELDQKRDKKTNEPVQFKLLREFEREWKEKDK